MGLVFAANGERRRPDVDAMQADDRKPTGNTHMRKNLRRNRAISTAARLLTGLALTLCLTTLASADDKAAAPKVKAGEIIVKAAPALTTDALRQLADKAGCDYLRSIPYCPGYYVVRLKKYSDAKKRPVAPVEIDADTTSTITALQQTSGILAADPNYVERLHEVRLPLIPFRRPEPPKTSAAKSRATAPSAPTTFTPNDPLYPKQWGMVAVRMPEAWTIQSGARSVVVGMVDSGIDRTHPDFALADGTGSRILAAKNFHDDDGTGANPVDPAAYDDTNGHGTHTAGTVGATTNNSTPTGVTGVAGYNGGNVDIKFKIARVFGTDGSATAEEVYSGFGYLIDENVDVINYSGGGNRVAATSLESTTIARGLAKGITIVVSLGNDSTDQGGNANTKLPGKHRWGDRRLSCQYQQFSFVLLKFRWEGSNRCAGWRFLYQCRTVL